MINEYFLLYNKDPNFAKALKKAFDIFILEGGRQVTSFENYLKSSSFNGGGCLYFDPSNYLYTSTSVPSGNYKRRKFLPDMFTDDQFLI